MMYSNILVPIDTTYANSNWVKASLEVAHDLVDKSKGTVIAISVVPSNMLAGYYPNVNAVSIIDQAKKKLAEIVEQNCPAGTKNDLRVEEGGVCAEILRVAQQLPADLIVMASHGPLRRDYILGSNAGHIALHAQCSVFVVRDTLAEDD